MELIESKAPIHPAKSRYYMRLAGLRQVHLANALNITRSAVSQYLDGTAYSQRFWDYYYEVVPVPKAS